MTPKPSRKKTSVAINPRLWRRVRIASAISGKEMSDILAEALEQELLKKIYYLPKETT